MKRYLIGLVVQQKWVEIDDEENAAELISQPALVPARELQAYVDQLLELAHQSKLDTQTEQTTTAPGDESGAD